MERKKILTLLFIGSLIFVSLFLLLSSMFTGKTPVQKPPFPTPTPVAIPRRPTAPPKEKINISGVLVNNFLQNPKRVDKSGDIFILETQEYRLIYFSKYNSFLISIFSSPFPKVKKQAEEDFLRALGISEIESCRLNVSVTTPYFANPDYSGKDWSLSFCENKK